jgi:hypothetical protein
MPEDLSCTPSFSCAYHCFEFYNGFTFSFWFPQVTRAILENPDDKTNIHLIYANVTYEDILLKVKLSKVVLYPYDVGYQCVKCPSPLHIWCSLYNSINCFIPQYAWYNRFSTTLDYKDQTFLTLKNILWRAQCVLPHQVILDSTV